MWIVAYAVVLISIVQQTLSVLVERVFQIPLYLYPWSLTRKLGGMRLWPLLLPLCTLTLDAQGFLYSLLFLIHPIFSHGQLYITLSYICCCSHSHVHLLLGHPWAINNKGSLQGNPSINLLTSAYLFSPSHTSLSSKEEAEQSNTAPCIHLNSSI